MPHFIIKEVLNKIILYSVLCFQDTEKFNNVSDSIPFLSINSKILPTIITYNEFSISQQTTSKMYSYYVNDKEYKFSVPGIDECRILYRSCNLEYQQDVWNKIKAKITVIFTINSEIKLTKENYNFFFKNL